MRGIYVERSVTAPDQWTEPLLIEPGRTAAVAVVPTGFAGTVSLQRSLDGGSWMDVERWVDSGVQGSFDAEVAQFLRAGVKTGEFALGQVFIRLEV